MYMAKIINGQTVLDAHESEILRQNLLHPNFENLNFIHMLYDNIDVIINDDGSWTVSCPDWNFDAIKDLTIQN